jgi:nucleotide-binding universal stress UspA family protein
MKPLDAKSRIAPRNVLLATDFSPASEAALNHAMAIAGHYGSKLYVAHVIGQEFKDLLAPEVTRTRLEHAEELTQQKIEQLAGAARERGVQCQALIGHGAVWNALLDLIRQNGIDLVVVGTHGRRGARKLLLGSVAEEVFRLAPCPVLTVGPKTSETQVADAPVRHVLYPLEFAPDSGDAALYAVSLSEMYHAKLTLLKVFEDMVPSPEEKAQVQEPVRHWIDDHLAEGSSLRERTSFELGFGPAAQAILKYAMEGGVDLIVMAVRRLDPIMAAHLEKPDTAYQVICSAPCPVLTIR